MLPSLVSLSSGDLLNHADPRSERALTRENEMAYGSLPAQHLASFSVEGGDTALCVCVCVGNHKKRKKKLSGISGITDPKTNQSVGGW